MSKKETAIRFIGIFFSWCVCIAFLPLLRALLAQRPVTIRWRGSITGKKKRKSEEGPDPHPARGQNVIPGDVNPVGASDRDTDEGGPIVTFSSCSPRLLLLASPPDHCTERTPEAGRTARCSHRPLHFLFFF